MISPAPLDDHPRFERLAHLGSGSTGDVYKVLDREIGIPIALKTLRDAAPEQTYRLKHEFRALAGLVHRNLVQLFELLIGDELRCFTMEYVDGCDFLQHLAPHIAEQRTTAYLDAAIQLLGGLRALHQAGRLHRDVKPSNLRVDPEGRVVLLDFDLAVRVGQDGESVLPSAAAGTFAYMPPETLWGKPIGPAADLFSAAVVLFEALTGELPYPSPLQIQSSSKPRRPIELAPWIPPWLDQLLIASLDPVADRRPRLEDALKRLLEQRSGEATLADRFVYLGKQFLGREDETARLRRAFREADPDAATVMCVSGSSGIGKSELLRRFVDQLELEPRALVLRGRCHPQELVPFKALDAIIDGLSRYLAGLNERDVAALLPADAAPLVKLFPVLGRIRQASQPEARSAAADIVELRQRAFAALRQLLVRVANQRRLVFWIDDLQWDDGDSAALIADLLRPPDVAPLFVLLSYRSEDADRISTLTAIERLRREEGIVVEQMEVRPLDSGAAAELAIALCSVCRDHPELTAQIVEEGRGVPFAIAELARHVNRDRRQLAPWAAEIAFAGVVGSRLRQLPVKAQRLAELVAVAGAPLERSTLLQASADGEPGRAIVALLESECLVRTTPVGSRLGVEAYHDRIREGVLEQLAQEQRSACHRALANALEASGRATPEELAGHFHGGGVTDKAATYALTAADKANESLAFLRAAEFYRKAREWSSAENVRAGTLMRSEAEAFTNAAHFVQAAPLFLQAATVSRAASESLDLQRLAVEQFLSGGYFDEGVAQLKRLLAQLQLRYPASNASALLRVLGHVARLTVRGYDLSPAQPQHDELERIRIDTCLAVAKRLVNSDSTRGICFSLSALRRAVRAGDRRRSAQALCIVGGSFAAVGSGRLGSLGQAMMARAQELANELQSPELLGTIEISTGQVLMLQARWAEALPHSRRGVEILTQQCRGMSFDCNIGRGNIERVLEELGDIDTLEEHSRELLHRAAVTGAVYAEVAAAQHLSIALIARDDLTQARALSRKGAELWSRQGFYMQHMYSMRQQAYCDLYEGKPHPAYKRAAEMWPAIRRSNLLRIPLARVDALSIRSRLALACACESAGADIDALLGVVDQDLKQLRRERRADASVHASLLAAGLAAKRGKQQEAVCELERAAAEGDSAAMPLHAEVARYRIGQLLGGENGQRSSADAATALRARGVREPSRWARLYAPGPWA